LLVLHITEMGSYSVPVAVRTTGVYDVKKLWYLTRDDPIMYIPLKFLDSNLDDVFWENSDGKIISPRMVLRNGSLSLDDSMRILQANLEYPILVYQFDRGVYDVIDGLHRLSKAFQWRHSHIKARVISDAQLEESKM